MPKHWSEFAITKVDARLSDVSIDTVQKAFSKFHRRYYELVSKFNVRLKFLLHQDLLEPEFFGDLV